jgi:hypothetical protein
VCPLLTAPVCLIRACVWARVGPMGGDAPRGVRRRPRGREWATVRAREYPGGEHGGTRCSDVELPWCPAGRLMGRQAAAGSWTRPRGARSARGDGLVPTGGVSGPLLGATGGLVVRCGRCWGQRGPRRARGVWAGQGRRGEAW